MFVENSHTSKIDLKQAAQHLKVLNYKHGDAVYTRYIHPATKKAIKKPKLDFAEANRYQAQGYDVYFVVNGGGDTDSDITDCRSIFYEHDDLDKALQLVLWQSLKLPEPTIQVDTGGKSIHSYWVFTDPINSDLWKALQTDLLKFSGGDRTLKNPSRILRLAGTWYMKGKEPGNTQAKIVMQLGQRYDYEELRRLVPQTQKLEQPPQNLNRKSEEIMLPVAASVPLELCLCKASRNFVENGAGNGERNHNGAKLARDLIGASSYLQKIGQDFDGDPWQIFLDYCRRCPDDDGWNETEWCF